VIKTYVRLGLGAGIVASMAVNSEKDADLVAIDASHLLAAHATWTGFHAAATSGRLPLSDSDGAARWRRR
jgi:hypothetical protein